MLILGAFGIYMMTFWSKVYPLLTVFFYMISSNAVIAILPHEPVIVWYGKTQSLIGLATVATLGTLLAGYLDNRFFAPILNLSYSVKYKASPAYQRAQRWFSKAPFTALALAGFLPLPFYPFKFLALASRYPLQKYLAAIAAGRFPRYCLLGLAGLFLQIPNWLIIAIFGLMIALIYHQKLWWIVSRPLVILARAFPRQRTENFHLTPETGENEMGQSIPNTLAARTIARATGNLILGRPICIALEVTHNCTANCKHCDKGPRVEDNAVGPERYREVCEALSPAVIQIAGGEPLWRHNILDIIRALHKPGRTPLLALVSNASLLTIEKYRKLREAGIRQFSISLDFPDDRHDDFRRIPGLFAHLNGLIPAMASFGNGDITINTCITRANYPFLLDIVETVARWGAKLNFSTYTDLRTRNDDYNLRHPEDTARLHALADTIFSRHNGASCVMTGEGVFRRYIKFYENGRNLPNCRTGKRFLVVNPDGRLTPCAMFIGERYDTLAELAEKFARRNNCGGCYVSIRANTEKPLRELIADNIRTARLSRRKTNSRD